MALLELAFRANPRYELVVFDRLPTGDRERFAALPREPDSYGVLRPAPDTGLGWKAVDRDTALLLFTLREPGRLPAYVATSLGVVAHRTIARLVAEGILEVDDGQGFVSGAAASRLLGMTPSTGEGDAGRLRALSTAALVHAQVLALADPLALAGHLYGYNRWPLTPRWKRRLPDGEAVRGFLGIASGGVNRRLLERSFLDLASSPSWLSWYSRSRRRAGAPTGEGGRVYKLYLSTPPETLGENFGEILGAFAAAAVPQFKVGAGVHGVLRPDKLVAHFGSFEQLAEAAVMLTERVAGLAVQGVPFTAEIGGDGLLSWGMDPPAAEARFLGGAPSWRSWLCRRLARALLDAETAPAGPPAAEPWRFALERLRVEGIDTGSWTPGALLWA
jgi:hypothetical protein